MMKTKFVLPALLVISASLVTPASANWFHNPDIGINRNIGSAPNPTPEDIRAMRVPVVTKDEDGTAPATATAQAAPAPANAAAPQKAPDTLASAIGRMFGR
jgi:hypothetical protein